MTGAGTLCAHLKEFAEEIHDNAVKQGQWEEGHRGTPEKIALMHAELSEALEATRHGNPRDTHVPEFSCLEIEMADVILRVLDFCAAHDLDIGMAMFKKMEFNKTRPYKHGKVF